MACRRTHRWSGYSAPAQVGPCTDGRADLLQAGRTVPGVLLAPWVPGRKGGQTGIGMRDLSYRLGGHISSPGGLIVLAWDNLGGTYLHTKRPS